MPLFEVTSKEVLKRTYMIEADDEDKAVERWEMDSPDPEREVELDAEITEIEELKGE